MNSDVEVRNSDIEISIETTEMKCTENACIYDKVMNKLQCGQCKRKVHCKCSCYVFHYQKVLFLILCSYPTLILCLGFPQRISMG